MPFAAEDDLGLFQGGERLGAEAGGSVLTETDEG